MIIRALAIDTPDYVLAYTEHKPRYKSDFLRHVQAVARQLSQIQTEQVILYNDDSYWFAVALCAAWSVRQRVALPADIQAITQMAGWRLLPEQVERWAQDESGVSFACAASVVIDWLEAELIVYTSGSSGQAKAIIKQWPQLFNEVLALEQQFGSIVADAVVLGTVSHQHLYGFLFRVLWPLLQGRPFSAQAAFFPEALMQQSRQFPKVIWIGSPAHYKRLNSNHDWLGIAPHVSALFSSGGILPAEVAETVRGYSGLTIHEIFGSSETGGVAQRQSGAGRQAWSALPGVKLQTNQEGALQIQSPHLSGDPDWYTMDDAVRMLTSGQFELLGRLDRIVKIEEKRISLVAIENALNDLPEIAEAAVFADTAQGREFIAAVVVLHDDAQLVRVGKYRFCEQLKRGLQTQLSQLALPRRWRFVTSLPVNAQGKVSQSALKALFEGENSSPVLPHTISMQSASDSVCYQLEMAPEIAYFAGHFTNYPVLPGVTQIHWAVHYARQHWSIPTSFSRMEVIKFQHVIQPADQVQLQLNWDEERQRLSFSFTSDKGTHSSGRLLFGEVQ